MPASNTASPSRFKSTTFPNPPPGAVLLRMTQAGICGSDLHVWRGDQVNVPLPPTGRAMGHEGTGVVETLGDGVTTDSAGAPVQKGDRVVYAAVFPCYACHQCLRGNTNWCMNRNYPAAGTWPYFTGTYADFLYLPPRHPFFRVPDELDDDLLGPVNCAMGTVTTGLIRAGAGEGDYVVIQGAGGLGVHATAMAKEMRRRPGHRPRPPGEPAGAGRRIRRRPHHQHRGIQHPRNPRAPRQAS